MIKYRTCHGGSEIKREEVERETKTLVVFADGMRNQKECQWYKYHDTFEEAHRYLVARCHSNIDKAHATIRKNSEYLADLARMKAHHEKTEAEK